MFELTPLERIVRGQLPHGLPDENAAARRIANAVERLYVAGLHARIADLEREVDATYSRTVATIGRDLMGGADYLG